MKVEKIIKTGYMVVEPPGPVAMELCEDINQFGSDPWPVFDSVEGASQAFKDHCYLCGVNSSQAEIVEVQVVQKKVAAVVQYEDSGP